MPYYQPALPISAPGSKPSNLAWSWRWGPERLGETPIIALLSGAEAQPKPGTKIVNPNAWKEISGRTYFWLGLPPNLHLHVF